VAILIKNGTLVTMNKTREVLTADLLIEGDRIAAIGKIDARPGDKVINARGMLVIPGLIQTHVHLCQTLFRGLADDLELLDWLKRRIFPLEKAHDSDSLYYSSLLGCAEMLRGGTTAIIDMGTVKHTTSIFAAVKQAGIRYLGGKCMIDNPDMGWGDSVAHSLQESLDLYQQWNGEAGDLIRYALCPRFVPSCSHEFLLSIQAMSDQYGIPVHTHASENRDEIALVEEERGRRNIAYLNDLGLCSQNLILAHCIHLSEEEKQILTTSQTNIVHCPSSNLKLGSGIAPVPEMMERGARVSLGADGAPCNNNMNMFMEMRLAALIHKPNYGSRAMPAEAVVEMATLGGAKALGCQEQLGSLETGKKADVVLINTEQWHVWPTDRTNVYSLLVYEAQAQDVYCTIVNGRIVMLSGELSNIPAQDTRLKASEALQRVWNRAGLSY